MIEMDYDFAYTELSVLFLSHLNVRLTRSLTLPIAALFASVLALRLLSLSKTRVAAQSPLPFASFSPDPPPKDFLPSVLAACSIHSSSSRCSCDKRVPRSHIRRFAEAAPPLRLRFDPNRRTAKASAFLPAPESPRTPNLLWSRSLHSKAAQKQKQKQKSPCCFRFFVLQSPTLR